MWWWSWWWCLLLCPSLVHVFFDDLHLRGLPFHLEVAANAWCSGTAYFFVHGRSVSLTDFPPNPNQSLPRSNLCTLPRLSPTMRIWQDFDRTCTTAGRIRFGVWVNVSLKGFRMKAVDFAAAGMSTDVPRPLSGASVAVRNVFVPYRFVRNSNSSNYRSRSSDVDVGGAVGSEEGGDEDKDPSRAAAGTALAGGAAQKVPVGFWLKIACGSGSAGFWASLGRTLGRDNK